MAHSGEPDTEDWKVLNRFIAKVRVVPCGGCWEWQAGKSRGYGQFSLGGKNRRAHRVSYELMVGSIPEGFQIDHLCRNRACVNPAHLEPVLPMENYRRGNGDYNRLKRQCPAGHPYDDTNTYVRPDGRRDCRVCGTERMRLRRAV